MTHIFLFLKILSTMLNTQANYHEPALLQSYEWSPNNNYHHVSLFAAVPGGN